MDLFYSRLRTPLLFNFTARIDSPLLIGSRVSADSDIDASHSRDVLPVNACQGRAYIACPNHDPLFDFGMTLVLTEFKVHETNTVYCGAATV